MSETPPLTEPSVSRRGEWRRVAVRHDGQDISHLGYAPKPIRVGAAGEVRLAGIGGVTTERERRREGHARRVFARSLEEMRAEGYRAVALYTGTDIVAHRLYRKFGFVDTQQLAAATKLLDPARCLCSGLARLLQGDDLPEELRDWRCSLRVDLSGGDPLFLVIDGQTVEVLPRKPRRTDLALTLSRSTFLGLCFDRVTLDYAAAANLVQWQGQPEHWQRLSAVFALRHQVIREGD